MRTMTCRQLGGPCDTAFQGDKADEVIKAQDKHLKELVGDPSHDDAAKAMAARWRNPVKGMGWYRQAKKDFAALPES
jgi:predicted small metal-binding protein